MNETTVTVVGNIASQVTARRVGAEGHFLVGFRIASSERRWDKASGTWTDGDRFSAWVSCWRRLGEHVSASLVKGDPVVVHGKVSVREYEVNGERRYSTELAASSVGPDLTRCRAQVTRLRPSGTDGDRAEVVVEGIADGLTESLVEGLGADEAGLAAEPTDAPPEQAEDAPGGFPGGLPGEVSGGLSAAA